jgi:hypothetical protein
MRCTQKLTPKGAISLPGTRGIVALKGLVWIFFSNLVTNLLKPLLQFLIQLSFFQLTGIARKIANSLVLYSFEPFL